MKQSDAIVIGSGVAGLSFAIKLAEKRQDLKISLFTKNKIIDSNSNYAQGGIASTFDFLNDSFEAHIADTLKSGGGQSNPKIVDFVIRSGPERIKELASYGVKFNQNKNANYDLGLEGGHSSPRIVHSFDHTGFEIIRSLVDRIKLFPNIKIHEHSFCFELFKTINGNIRGVRIFNTNSKSIEDYLSRVVILSTGGSGQVYKYTTNPSVATGDGLALGIKVGAKVSNLNYFQFHPTAFVENNKSQLFLISEALRGFGAHIVNDQGSRFLFNYDERGELATRDIVSMAIYKELKNNKVNHVFLDCRHLELSSFEKKFPTIFRYLIEHGIDVSIDLIPVIPAAHYQCGGLKVDIQARTNLNGLFAIGEVAETGLHGANRLASNSLLEALVFAHETANYITENIDAYSFEFLHPLDKIHVNEKNDLFHNEINQKIKNVMSNNVTIASCLQNIKNAKSILAGIERQVNLRENESTISTSKLILKNTLLVAQEIIKASLLNIKKNDKTNPDQTKTSEHSYQKFHFKINP